MGEFDSDESNCSTSAPSHQYGFEPCCTDRSFESIIAHLEIDDSAIGALLHQGAQRSGCRVAGFECCALRVCDHHRILLNIPQPDEVSGLHKQWCNLGWRNDEWPVRHAAYDACRARRDLMQGQKKPHTGPKGTSCRAKRTSCRARRDLMQGQKGPHTGPEGTSYRAKRETSCRARRDLMQGQKGPHAGPEGTSCTLYFNVVGQRRMTHQATSRREVSLRCTWTQEI
jgi:hypothetical protein